MYNFFMCCLGCSQISNSLGCGNPCDRKRKMIRKMVNIMLSNEMRKMYCNVYHKMNHVMSVVQKKKSEFP